MNKIKDKKILITGGAGFIASHIYDLLYEDNEVSIIDNLSSGTTKNLPKGTKIYKFDLSNQNEWKRGRIEKLVKDCDVIIDCAAQVSTFESMIVPRKDFVINGFGKMMLIDTIVKVNSDALFIYTSSRSIHGEIPDPFIANEMFPYKSHSFYNLDKYYIEDAVRLYHKTYGLNYVVIRPANVYGPRMPSKGLYGFMCRWIAYTIQNKPIQIWGDGKQIRDFMFVTDIAKAYPMVIDNPSTLNQEFLLSSGRAVRLLELVELITEMCGKDRMKIEFLPQKVGDIKRFVGDYRKAKLYLGWYPEVTLEQGLRITINWVKNNIDRYKEYNLN